MMTVLVCGGRDYTNWREFNRKLTKLADEHFPRVKLDNYGNYFYNVKIIAGGARGADQLAIQWAQDNATANEEYLADWEQYGPAAGPIRNRNMLKFGKPDLVIAFPGGKGTADMVRISEKAGVRVIHA